MLRAAEPLVCTFDTAVKLVAAGLWSNTYFVWVCDGEGRTRVQEDGLHLADDERAIPAYTLAELLAALPRTIDADPHGNGYDDTFHRCLWSGANGKDYLTYTGEEDGLERLELPDGTEAEEEAEDPTEGAARLWLRLSSASLLSPARPSGAA